MSQLRKRRGARLTGSEFARLAELPALRDRALRAVSSNASHIFVSAELHKGVVTFLFSAYLTSSGTEEQIALEFWSAYRHIAEGRPIFEFPFTLINRDTTVSALRRILGGSTDVNSHKADDNE